jgi:hypothetical protein
VIESRQRSGCTLKEVSYLKGNVDGVIRPDITRKRVNKQQK